MTANRLARGLVGVQGGYDLLSGAWPLVSLASFEAITGPKTDDWLVHTVGALVIAVGLALLVAARRPVPLAETMTGR